MSLIQIKNLKKQYGKEENKVNALQGVSLEIERGQMVAIMGHSGCGKSTLLNLIAGIDVVSSGNIIVENCDITKLNDNKLAFYRRRYIGIVYQFFNMIPNLSVENNIKLPVLLDNKNVSEKYFQGLVTSLGIKEKLNVFPDELSGGQQQRVAIARSLIYKPILIIADEPTGNLDQKTSKEIVDLFRFTNLKFNQTIIIVTHDEKIALSTDRIIRMEDGLILSDEVLR